MCFLADNIYVQVDKKCYYLQVVKENQVLHKGSKVIEGECDTLADFNIFPGDLLWVTDSEIHEYRDIAGNSILLIIKPSS